MAEVKIRGASVYVNGKKLGNIENSKYHMKSGDEPQFGDPGFIGYSDGAMTTNLSGTGVIPVKGMGVDLVAVMKAKQSVDIMVSLIDGHIHAITMRTLEAEFDSSHKSGVETGT